MILKIPNHLKNRITRISTFKYHLNHDTKIYLHFYNPIGAGDWYVIVGNKKGKDFEFLGVVFFTKPRLARFTLNDLKKMKLPFGEKIRINKNFKLQTWGEVMASRTS